MLRFLLIRPGSTDLDDQGRITGSLDIPLSEHGAEQVRQTADELDQMDIEVIYSSPCQSAVQTAKRLARNGNIKMKIDENLANLDHGLWHGKRIDELKLTQPKIYKKWQEEPEAVCPPGGETVDQARQRIRRALKRIARKRKTGIVAVVIPEPLATIFRSEVCLSQIGDIWKTECECGSWESFAVPTDAVA